MLLDCFNHTPGEEQSALIVVFEFLSRGIAHYMLPLKVIIIVDEINLHPCRLDRGYLNYQGMISVVNYEIHP